MNTCLSWDLRSATHSFLQNNTENSLFQPNWASLEFLEIEELSGRLNFPATCDVDKIQNKTSFSRIFPWNHLSLSICWIEMGKYTATVSWLYSFKRLTNRVICWYFFQTIQKLRCCPKWRWISIVSEFWFSVILGSAKRLSSIWYPVANLYRTLPTQLGPQSRSNYTNTERAHRRKGPTG